MPTILRASLTLRLIVQGRQATPAVTRVTSQMRSTILPPSGAHVRCRFRKGGSLFFGSKCQQMILATRRQTWFQENSCTSWYGLCQWSEWRTGSRSRVATWLVFARPYACRARSEATGLSSRSERHPKNLLCLTRNRGTNGAGPKMGDCSRHYRMCRYHHLDLHARRKTSVG